jgi:putative pyruvate formate lyase activating enzyme
MGKAVSPELFSEICLALQNAGAENINIVTGSHAIPSIATGLKTALSIGLSIPVLWNSSAYEKPEALALLKGLVTVWLPDMKTLNPLLSASVFRAEDYPKVSKKAIRFMTETSPLVIDHPDKKNYPAGRIRSGVIVRHLALPGKIADTEVFLRWFAEHLAGKALLSLMTQYTPVKNSPHTRNLTAFPDRILDKTEYRQLTDLLENLDIDNGFYQEFMEDTDWLPDFSLFQPFSSNLARPVWHHSSGFIN